MASWSVSKQSQDSSSWMARRPRRCNCPVTVLGLAPNGQFTEVRSPAASASSRMGQQSGSLSSGLGPSPTQTSTPLGRIMCRSTIQPDVRVAIRLT